MRFGIAKNVKKNDLTYIMSKYCKPEIRKSSVGGHCVTTLHFANKENHKIL